MRRVALSLFVFLLLALFGCGPSKIILSPFPPPSVLGFTYCHKDGPGAFINVTLIRDGGDVIGTMAHELKHVEQMRRFKDCASFMEWANVNPRVEAEAFCEEVKLETPIFGRELSIIKYGEWLSLGYPRFALSQLAAESLLREFC